MPVGQEGHLPLPRPGASPVSMLMHSRPARLLAFAIAAVAGYVDAVGFLGSGQFFVSFMSGNTTRLGVGIAGDGAAALVAASLIASFVAGVTVTSLLRRRVSGSRRIGLNLVFCAAMLTVAALAAESVEGLVPIALLAFAMGGINLVLENEGEVRFGLTYITGTLIKLGTRLADAIAGAPRADWLALLLLWLALAGGGTLGGLAFGALDLYALWPAVAATWLIGAIALFGSRD